VDLSKNFSWISPHTARTDKKAISEIQEAITVASFHPSHHPQHRQTTFTIACHWKSLLPSNQQKNTSITLPSPVCLAVTFFESSSL
jgi:hypothetical protein